MKKIVCILLAAVMVLMMASCGAPRKTEPADTDAGKTEAEAQTNEEAAAAEEPAKEEEAKAGDMLGEKNGNSYVNKALGIRVDFPETWSLLDDEQTAQVFGVAMESFTDEALAEQLQKSGTLYDMYAMALDQSGDNVNITLEDLGVIYGIVIDEAKYIELAEKQLITSFEQMGMTNVQLEKGSYSFAGQDRTSVLLTATYSGTPIYERMVLIKTGSYMSMVTAFSMDAGRLDQIMGFFSAYEG